MIGRFGLALAAGVLVVGEGAAAARARVLDPEAKNLFDLRFDAGFATPVGSAGGVITVPFHRVAVEGGFGMGLTGVHFELMPKVVLLRGGRNSLLLGAGASLVFGHGILPYNTRRTWFKNIELAFQRVAFIDNIVYVGVGATQGITYAECSDPGFDLNCGRQERLWPSLRVGWGRRY